MNNKKTKIVCIAILIILAIISLIIGATKDRGKSEGSNVATKLDAIKTEQKGDNEQVKSERHTVISKKMYDLVGDDVVKLLNDNATIENENDEISINTDYAQDRTAIKEGIKNKIKSMETELNSAGISVAANVDDGTITVTQDKTQDTDQINRMSVIMGLYQKIEKTSSEWLVLISESNANGVTTRMMSEEEL